MVFNLKFPVKIKGNIKLCLNKSSLELHYYSKVKKKICNSGKVIGVDKGIRKLVHSSSGEFYGEKTSIKLKKLIQYQTESARKRDKITSYVRKLENQGNFEKAKTIRKNNLGGNKRDKKISALTTDLKNDINENLNRFIAKECPKLIICEKLNTKPRNKGKHLNRLFNYWRRGYLHNRLEFKCYENGIDLKQVNPAYTSQICHTCDSFGRRKGDKFYCNHCGGVYDSDFNASVNILKRYYDSEISLFTPYKKVKEILESRLLERRKAKSLSSTVPTKSRELSAGETVRSFARTAEVNPTAN